MALNPLTRAAQPHSEGLVEPRHALVGVQTLFSAPPTQGRVWCTLACDAQHRGGCQKSYLMLLRPRGGCQKSYLMHNTDFPDQAWSDTRLGYHGVSVQLTGPSGVLSGYQKMVVFLLL